MKILHTADWHIGSHKGPEKDGINLRSQDTLNCLASMVSTALKERPDMALISGDIFDRAEIWQGRSHKEVLQARNVILELSKACNAVIVMRGTPNHDSAEAFEELRAHFEFTSNVEIVTEPKIIQTPDFDIAVLPGFDRGTFRATHPGLGKEEENEVITQELSNIVLGLKAKCDPNKKSILMSHYTIPGCNAESGQTMMLTQFEPILPVDTLNSAGFDLVAMGHIHRPQKLDNVPNCYYSGAINALNFNDEGQERGFWIHEEELNGWKSTFHKTPYREFITFHFTDTDIAAINLGDEEAVATNFWRYNGAVEGKIVRILYSCSLENQKALNKASLERLLTDDGAFYVWEILPEKIEETANRTELSGTRDPEENLRRYLEEKEFKEEKIQELILKARPIIALAEASISTSGGTGIFEPVEIEVKNYRNYEEERFNFEDISFCTINGQNGAGKSSLFMDAIIDCLYEEPREGELTGWIRNDEKARSGSIMFTFRIGEKTFRVTRTRARSGKGTLNISEYTDGEWHDRSMEKYKDTQDEIINILGMDSLTFKSCALIMQDQYGLFLQAQKEDRMVILGNLLGLGVYEAMNKIAAENARENGAKKRDLKQEIEIHEETISGLGDPQSLIEAKQADLKVREEETKTVKAERDARKLELLSLQEAQERCNKLSESITALEAKKAATETNRKAQEDIITSCKAVLSTEQTVMEKASRYRELEARQLELIEASALFQTKQEDVKKGDSRIKHLNSDLASEKLRLHAEQERLAVCEDAAGDEEALKNAERYKAEKARLDDIRSKALDYQKVSQRVKDAEAVRDGTRNDIEVLDNLMASKRSLLEKDIALLSSDCGCIDIEKANCKFLEKAKTSKKNLAEEEETYSSRRRELEELLLENEEAVNAACKSRDAIGYDPEQEASVEKLCSELIPYVEKAERVKQKAGEVSLIKATIENTLADITDLETRIEETTTETEKAKEDLEKYRKAFEENREVTREMSDMKPWMDQERQLPVIHERLSNAMQRLSELELQGTEQEQELVKRQAELSQELLKTVGFSKKQEEVASMENWLSNIEKEIKDIQMEIGALTQKVSQIEALKKEVATLREKMVIAADATADYDTLKTAFSQDGIPHQIIRTIVPQLESTANSILGQMTGGKMGITFKTEKVMKSNKNKEVVALDIFIEEFGKAALPYLSKSGGEKVKASLSVILALAEIKSSAAGIQLGMLFIDEPPFLDSDGIQAYCDALETIQQRYEGIKIMAITHDPTMKARFPQNLDVVKTEQGSKVVYQ